MEIRSSRLVISVLVHSGWSGKSISETDLDFTFYVWLVSTKFIKNGLTAPSDYYTRPKGRHDKTLDIGQESPV